MTKSKKKYFSSTKKIGKLTYLKNNKIPRPNGMVAENIKYGGNLPRRKLTQLIIEI